MDDKQFKNWLKQERAKKKAKNGKKKIKYKIITRRKIPRIYDNF